MDSFALKYLLLIFGGCLGIYQIAAAAAGFKGLWFFKTAALTHAGGFLIAGSTLVWFFKTTDLHMRHAGIEGAQQLSFFLLGSFLGLVTTFLISSLVNWRRPIPEGTPLTGNSFEDLKERTVFQAFSQRLKNRNRSHE